MTISQEIAKCTAIAFAKKKGYGKFVLCGADFHEERVKSNDLPFLKPSPARWIVRFQNPKIIEGACIDDGDRVICVEVDANTGAASLLKGM